MIDDISAPDDRVVTKTTLTGTQNGDVAEMTATGKRVNLRFVDILRVREDKIG
jgi:predicted ester cyclase